MSGLWRDCRLLAAHDVRLLWFRFIRSSTKTSHALGLKPPVYPALKTVLSAWPYWLFGGLVLLGAIGFGLGVVAFGAGMAADDAAEIWPLLALGLIGVFLWMIFGALSLIAGTLFLRGDMDLLRASPLDPRAIAIVRLFNISVFCSVIPLIGAVGIFVGALIRGAWSFLWAAPATLAMGMMATALAVIVAFGLVQVIGPRRIQSTVHLVSAFAGLGVLAVFQTNNFVDWPGTKTGWFVYWLTQAYQTQQDLAIFAVPRAIFARGPIPLTAFVFGSVGVYAVTMAILGKALMELAAQPIQTRAQAARGPARAFTSGAIWSVVLKEWRIIRRNPMVLAALGAQMFYLLPAVVSPIALAFRRGAADPQTIAVFLAAGCVLGSSTMAGRGLWIVAGGEHAPDLLRTAPAHPGVIRWGKIFSVAGISVMLCAIIISGALLFGVSWFDAAIALLGAAITALAVGRVQWRYIKPISMKDLNRTARFSLVGGLIQFAITMLIGATATLFVYDRPLFALLTLALAAAAFYAATTQEGQSALFESDPTPTSPPAKPQPA